MLILSKCYGLSFQFLPNLVFIWLCSICNTYLVRILSQLYIISKSMLCCRICFPVHMQHTLLLEQCSVCNWSWLVFAFTNTLKTCIDLTVPVSIQTLRELLMVIAASVALISQKTSCSATISLRNAAVCSEKNLFNDEHEFVYISAVWGMGAYLTRTGNRHPPSLFFLV